MYTCTSYKDAQTDSKQLTACSSSVDGPDSAMYRYTVA